MTKPRFTISVVCFTNLSGAKACIASVLKSTVPFDLILTANGNPAVSEYFEELKAEYGNIRVIHNSTNQGFIAPNRFAFGLCETPYFVMINDDVVVPPIWLEKLVRLHDYEDDETMAITGHNRGCYSLRDDFTGWRGFVKGRGYALEYVEFSCAMVRTSIMRELGLFSDYLDFANCEDADSSLRAREAGYRIGLIDIDLRHEVGATRKHVPGLAEIYQRNLKVCQKRWADYLKSPSRLFPNEKWDGHGKDPR